MHSRVTFARWQIGDIHMCKVNLTRINLDRVIRLGCMHGRAVLQVGRAWFTPLHFMIVFLWKLLLNLKKILLMVIATKFSAVCKLK